MQTLARLQRIRIAPRKMRMVVDLVRGKKVAIAKDVLRFSKNRGARILSKLLDSAVASARSLGQGDESSLMVLKIAVDEGPKLKRWRARAKGSAYPIQKKVSNITLILDEAKGETSTSEPKKEGEKVERITPVRSLEALGKPGAISNALRARLAKSPARVKQLTLAQKAEKGFPRFFRRKAI